MKEITDEKLMAGLQQGNSQNFERLVERYGTALYRFIYRILKDEGEAQDLVQETFLRVYRSAGQYDSKYPFRVWIFSIASHLAINVLNSARRRRIFFFWNRSEHDREQEISQEEEIVDPRKNPEEEFSHQQMSQRVQQAIDSLSPRQKVALTLSKLEGLSYKEIADVMDINLPAVESLIFRAKQKIQRELG